MSVIGPSPTPQVRPPSFGDSLRTWRHLRGWSQLELSFEAQTSARHISYLENARSVPSRAMVLRLMNALEVPLRDRNPILASAGYAPIYRESDLGDSHLVQVRRAMRFLLEQHEPYPAYVLDRTWDIVDANATHYRLLDTLLPGAAAEAQNALDLLLDPRRLRPRVRNWERCAHVVLRRVRRQLQSPEPRPELNALVERIRSYPEVERLLGFVDDRAPEDILIPLELDFGGATLRWLTTLATFGTAQDATLQDTVIECLFPADEATEAIVRSAGR